MSMVKLDLGEVGLLWTRKCLSSGRAWSQYLAGALEFSSGITIVPGIESLPLGADNDLAVSITGAREAPQPGAAEALFEIILPILRTAPLLLVEDDLRREDDPNLLSEDPASIISGSGIIFHLRDSTQLKTFDSLRTFLGASGSGYPLNAFLLSGITRDELIQQIETDEFEGVAPHVGGVINTVFDCDAFAVWLGRQAQAILREHDTARNSDVTTDTRP